MEMENNTRDVFCSDCDVKFEVVKSGYKIKSIKDLIGFEGSHINEKVIECQIAELSICPQCNKHSFVDKGEEWLSLADLYKVFCEKRIFSDNPEIQVMCRVLSMNIGQY